MSRTMDITVGGRKDKLKKFPRIVDYLEVSYPGMYEIIDDLAMAGNLTPHRGGGITFLVPDKEYLAEIKKMAESDDPEIAIDMIDSLILLDLFTSPKQFQRKEDIATKAGSKLIVKKINADSVEVDAGVITLDTKFRPIKRHGHSERDNMAVWHLKGRVKYLESDGIPRAKVVRRKPGKSADTAVEGGGSRRHHRGGSEAADELHKIKCSLLSKKYAAVADNKVGNDGGRVCPLLNAVTRVLRVFREKYYEEYKYAKCVLTGCPFIDFYLLFNNPLIFDPSVVLSAYNEGIDADSNVDFYRQFNSDYSHPAFVGEKALMLNEAGVRQVNNVRDEIRDAIMSRLSAKKTPDEMCRVYKVLDQTNTMGEGTNVYPVYPEKLAEKFRDNAGLHLMLDEFCYLAYRTLKDIKARPYADERAAGYKELTDMICAGYGCSGFVNPSKHTKLDKSESYGTNVGVDSLYQLIINFWRTFGVHTPSSTDIEDRLIIGGREEYDPKDMHDCIDVDSEFANDLNSYENAPMTLSESAIAELRHYARKHGGKLPSF